MFRLALLIAAALLYASPSRSEPALAARSGQLRVVTYNVAGLPEGLSGSRPLTNLPLIGAALERFDLVFVQEDYAYPALLRSRLRLPYRSRPFERGQAHHFGDGLSQFAKLPFGELRRLAWRACHGVVDAYFDCWTPKGLSFTRLELSPGVGIDTYNVHLDAGGANGDVGARAAQLQQLFETIQRWSGERAVVLGGDFNLTRSELPLLRRLAKQARFKDSCDELGCGQSFRLDRILYRGGAALELRARSWRAEASLRDAEGRALSDHLPVVVLLEWRTPAGGGGEARSS